MKRAMRIILVLLLAIAVSAAVSYLVHERVMRPAQAREEAFTALRAGTLAPGPGGVTPLPEKWAAGSADGKAYVSGRPAGTMWVLFPSDVGRGSIGGHLLCTRANQSAPKSTIELECTPAGKPMTMRVVRALNPFSFDVVSER